MNELSVSHLLGIKDLTEADIHLIFQTADHFKEVINRPIKKFLALEILLLLTYFLRIVPELVYPLSLQKSVCRQIRLIFQPPLLR